MKNKKWKEGKLKSRPLLVWRTRLGSINTISHSEACFPFSYRKAVEKGVLLYAVNPSVQSVRLWLRTGRTAECGGCPGQKAVVASVLMLALDGLWGRQVS